MAKRSELVSGQGRGRIQRMYGEWGGKQVQIDQEVIEYEPARLLGWKHIRELIEGKPAPAISQETVFTIRLEAIETGTRVTLLSRNLPGNALKALVIKLIAKPRILRSLNEAAECLAALPLDS